MSIQQRMAASHDAYRDGLAAEHLDDFMAEPRISETFARAPMGSRNDIALSAISHTYIYASI